MANAKRDQNSRPTVILASNADGVTVLPLLASPVTHRMKTDDNSTGSDAGNNLNNAMLDESSVAVWTALSADDGETVVEIYADSLTGKILIDSN